MTDPEIEHRRLVAGDAPAVRAAAESLDAALHLMSGVRADLAAAEVVPVWSGPAAVAFSVRATTLRQGLAATRSALVRARGALVGSAADSLRTGARAVSGVSELLTSTARDYTRTDDRVGGAFRGITPR